MGGGPGLPRVFLHHEGLTRFCTTPYAPPASGNADDATVHLSNYSVNKWSADYVKEEGTKAALAAVAELSHARTLRPGGGQYLFGGGAGGGLGSGLDEPEAAATCRTARLGSKWTLSAFAAWAAENGHDVGLIWRRCRDVVAKTLLAAAVTRMRDQYRADFGGGDPSADEGLRCFEILGIDILLTEELRPYLLEVNMSPSAAMGSALDRVVKEAVHHESLLIAAAPPCPADRLAAAGGEPDAVHLAQQRWRAEYEARVLHGFERVLPPPEGTCNEKLVAAYDEIAAWRR